MVDAKVNDANPYAPPLTQTTEPPALAKRDRRRGPAIPIALGALIGGPLCLLLSTPDTPFGVLGVLPGSILGGLYFRLRSSRWPIDPTARRRRFGYATLSILLLPALTAILTGMRGQGLQLTILALLIGMSVAIGILLSGDRRAEGVQQGHVGTNGQSGERAPTQQG